MTTLPIGWSVESLAKLGTWTGGGTPYTGNPAFWTNGTIPWVSPKDMKQRRIAVAQDSITAEALKSSTTNLIAANSVMLVTRSGILRHSLPVAINAKQVTMNQDMKALTPLEGVDSDYLYFAFCRFEREILHKCRKGGTTVQSIEASRLMAFEIPIAPICEQRRIVAKIEELFSELDKGIENLKKARAQLEVYLQALLRHAFEGKLTAAWRASHHDTPGPNPPLKERAAIPSEITAALPKLPAGWSHVRLGDIIEMPTYGTSKKCDYATVGVGVLRIPNVVAGSIDSTDLKFASFSADEIESYALKVGDLLMIRSNGSVSIVGRCARVTEAHTHLLYAGYLIRLRPVAAEVDSAFLRHQLGSHTLRTQIEKTAKSTSGVNNINSGEIRSLVVAICSPREQRQILAELERSLAVVDSLASDIDANLQKSEALRQSILEKAFAGELVPQNPTDEPAASLLARIRGASTKIN